MLEFGNCVVPLQGSLVLVALSKFQQPMYCCLARTTGTVQTFVNRLTDDGGHAAPSRLSFTLQGIVSIRIEQKLDSPVKSCHPDRLVHAHAHAQSVAGLQAE